MNIFIRIAFYGKNYYGTQIQPRFRTIQGEFTSALSRIYDTPLRLTISSRLDRGVSALDFGINFQAPERDISLQYLSYYLSKTLDDDIYIRSVDRVSDDFSARFSMRDKTYLYLIQAGPIRNPLLSPLTHQEVHELDLQRMREAIGFFRGTHDFRYFAKPEREDENTILTIDETDVYLRDGIYHLIFRGKSFLRYQVRFMVGTIINYSLGLVSEDTISRLLDGENITYRKLKAEPQGLILDSIYYPDIDAARKFIDPFTNSFPSMI